MTPHRRVILLVGFPSLLAFVSASPVPLSNTTTFRPRDILGDNDWLSLDSVGMMLPSTEGSALPGMSNLLHAGDGLLPRSDERRYASRDVVRRDAIFGVHKDTGESLYVLKRDAIDGEEPDKQGSLDRGYGHNDDDQEELEKEEEQVYENDELHKREEEEEGEHFEDDDDDDDEDDDNDEKEEEEEDDPEDYEADFDKRENHELAARHESLLKGISVLGAPTFSRRNEGWLSRLFRRRKSKSSSRSNSKQSSRKNRNRSKKNKKQRKSKSRKDKGKGKGRGKGKGKGRKNKSSGAFDLKNLDLMKGATILTTITWYTGIDLLNPFCDRKTRWTPTDDSLIIAVTEKWSKRPSCGEFMEITTTDDKEARSVIARIVDLCGGCIPEVAHADLSKAAFRKLYDLDVGRVHGLKMRRVGAPKRWSEKLYGPRTL